MNSLPIESMELPSTLATTQVREASTVVQRTEREQYTQVSVLASISKHRGIWIILFLSIASSWVAGGLLYHSMQANINSLENEIRALKQSITKPDVVMSTQLNDFNFNETSNSGSNKFVYKESGNKFISTILGPIESQVGILWKTIKDLRRDFGTMQIETRNVTQILKSEIVTGLQDIQNNLTEINESDCGGIIEIPTTKTTFFLKYKLSKPYANIERCFWTVETTKGVKRFKLSLGITLVSHGFADSSDGLYVFGWNRLQNITSRKLVHNKQHVQTSEGIYFLFFSNGAGTGSGFSLRLNVLEMTANYNGSNWYYRSAPGIHEISSYGNMDAMSIVISPRNRINFSVKKIKTEAKHDYLDVFEIGNGGAYTFRGRTDGDRTNPLAFISSDPILCMFSTDGSRTAEGFQISWT